MDDQDALHGGGKVVPLRPKTIDDGEIRLGPVRVEPLTAAQEAQVVDPRRWVGGRRSALASTLPSLRWSFLASGPDPTPFGAGIYLHGGGTVV